MAIDLFYQITNSQLIILFIIVLSFLNLLGLYLFIWLTSCGYDQKFNNHNTNTYITIITVVISVLIAFIITDEWNAFSKADSNLTEEANLLYLVIQTLLPMPNTEDTVKLINQYICSIINMEFPAMEQGVLAVDNPFLDALQTQIYDYQPQTERDYILYGKSIDLLNQAIFLRNTRFETSANGIPNELWWVLLIGYVVIIVMSYFITGDVTYRIYMTILMTIVYASLLFLIVALDYPFKGDFGLAPDAFQLILNRLGMTC